MPALPPANFIARQALVDVLAHKQRRVNRSSDHPVKFAVFETDARPRPILGFVAQLPMGLIQPFFQIVTQGGRYLGVPVWEKRLRLVARTLISVL